MKVIKKEESRIYLDGPETCRECVITPKIVFGSSTPHPGRTRGIDPGRPEGHKVFYISRGKTLVYNTQTDEFCELHKSDIILVYEGEPRELTNIGTDTAVTTWNCAPKID